MASAAGWNDYDFVVQMPHMAPGEKLSEVEFLKVLAAHQWESIARALHRRPSEIASEHNERLYGSVIDFELHLGEPHSMEVLGEDATVHVKNQVRFFAKKFVEGLFVIDDAPIGAAAVEGVKCREDLTALSRSWACMTNAFIARSGANTRLKVFRPAGTEALDLPELASTPYGILEQGRSQRAGSIDALEGFESALPLLPRRDEPVEYAIVPESDLNGAGLVYFARYEAMMNFGERILLTQRLERPLSTELVACLSTEHRRAFFFGNATPQDRVQVHVSARLLPAHAFEKRPPAGAYRVPAKFFFDIELYRASDGVLMALSRVRKSLNVPGNAKSVLAEVERLLRRLGVEAPD